MFAARFSKGTYLDIIGMGTSSVPATVSASALLVLILPLTLKLDTTVAQSPKQSQMKGKKKHDNTCPGFGHLSEYSAITVNGN